MTGGGVSGPVGGVAAEALAHGLSETIGAAWQATLSASLLSLKETAGPAHAPQGAMDPAALSAASSDASPSMPVSDSLALASPATASPAAIVVPGGHRDTQNGLLASTRDAASRQPSDNAATEAGAWFAGATATTTSPATAMPPTPAGHTGALPPPLAGQAGMVLAQAAPSTMPGAIAGHTPDTVRFASPFAAPTLAAGQPSSEPADTRSFSSPTGSGASLVAARPVETPVSIPATIQASLGSIDPPPVVENMTAPVPGNTEPRSTEAQSPAPTMQADAAPSTGIGLPGLAAPALIATPATTMLFAVDYPGVPPGAGPLRPSLARERRTAPLVQHAPPREPSLVVQDFRTVSAAIQCISYGERRPVPIDIAPHLATVPAWRLDDTEILVVADARGHDAASARAVVLHRALMDDGAGLAALQPGEGFATWEGSPLWLRLAGIDKPAEAGVLLDRSVPPRLSVMRTGDTTWRVDGDDVAQGATRDTLHPYGDPASASLRDAILFAGCQRGEGTIAATLPHRIRVQEAWAAVARCLRWHATGTAPAFRACLEIVARGVPDGPSEAATTARVLEAAMRGDQPAMLARLRGLGVATLNMVAAGKVHEIGPLEGLALAMALGRLPVRDTQA